MRATHTAPLAVLLLVLTMAAALCLAAAPGSSYPAQRSKPRSIRGFKNVALATARGFGKRDGLAAAAPASPDLGEQDHLDRIAVDSLPVDWFVEELRTNPELARIIVHKFVDVDQDGELSADELLRPVY